MTATTGMRARVAGHDAVGEDRDEAHEHAHREVDAGGQDDEGLSQRDDAQDGDLAEHRVEVRKRGEIGDGNDPVEDGHAERDEDPVATDQIGDDFGPGNPHDRGGGLRR